MRTIPGSWNEQSADGAGRRWRGRGFALQSDFGAAGWLEGRDPRHAPNSGDGFRGGSTQPAIYQPSVMATRRLALTVTAA